MTWGFFVVENTRFPMDSVSQNLIFPSSDMKYVMILLYRNSFIHRLFLKWKIPCVHDWRQRV
jgi:hypothetical protein